MNSEIPRENLSETILENRRLIAIIPAAGSGERLGLGIPKALANVQGETVLTRTLSRFLSIQIFSRIIVTAPCDYLESFQESIKRAEQLASLNSLPVSSNSISASGATTELIEGGSTRAKSVRNAINALSQERDEETLVLLHDAARIFVSEELIRCCIEVADRTGAASAAVPVVDTLRRASAIKGLNQLGQVVDRDHLWGMQTPQVFRLSLLRRALTESDHGRMPSTIMTDDPALKAQILPEDIHLYETDEVGLVQRFSPVEFVQGSPLNFKVTTLADLDLARRFWSAQSLLNKTRGWTRD